MRSSLLANAPVLGIFLALVLVLPSCFEEEEYAGCPFTPSQQKACTTQGQDDVEGINCVISQHPECPDGICIMYQNADPFCSRRCNDDLDCGGPDVAVCVQFTMDCGVTGADCAKYCVVKSLVEDSAQD